MSPEDVRSAFEYDSETGDLFRRSTGRLLCQQDKKSKQVDFNGRKYSKTHIIWMIVYGRWPEAEIDHIHGHEFGERLDNLREATRSQNNQNASKRSGWNSKYKGLRLRDGRWQARINDNRKIISLGSFDTEEEAARAYDSAALVYHGQFAKLNFPMEEA